MTKIIFMAHSGWRWVALLAVVVAFGYGLWGWLGGKSWNPTGRKLAMFATIALDIQLLLGLTLYALEKAWASGLPTGVRFEHPTMMILALVAIHAMSVRVKRGSGDQARYRWLALGTLAALVLVVVGISRLPGGAERLFTVGTSG